MISQLFPQITYWDTEPRGPRRAAVLDLREFEVSAVKGDGFKTSEGTWLNWSKFREPSAYIMPSPGDTVRVGLDSKGFIRQLSIVAPDGTAQPRAIAGGAPQLAPTTIAALAATRKPEPEPDWLTGAEPAERVVLSGHIEQDDRGRVITRLAVLNTAAAILSSGGGAATADDVLALAGQLEAWATR